MRSVYVYGVGGLYPFVGYFECTYESIKVYPSVVFGLERSASSIWQLIVSCRPSSHGISPMTVVPMSISTGLDSFGQARSSDGKIFSYVKDALHCVWRCTGLVCVAMQHNGARATDLHALAHMFRRILDERAVADVSVAVIISMGNDLCPKLWEAWKFGTLVGDRYIADEMYDLIQYTENGS